MTGDVVARLEGLMMMMMMMMITDEDDNDQRMTKIR